MGFGSETGSKTFHGRVPSEGAGGGTLAVQVVAPKVPRYPEGAPVYVFVLGGFSPEGYGHGLRGIVGQGFVQITYNYPGGGQGRTRSEGQYDYRGLKSFQATRDVIRFALGEFGDDRGRKLHEIVGQKILYKNVGVFGSSSGGLVFFSTFAHDPEALKSLAFYVGWENPTTGQTLLVDLGGRSSYTGKPLPNPAFAAYGPESCKVDYSALKWDAEKEFSLRDLRNMGRGPTRRTRGVLYLDNNGNGRCDVEPGFGARLPFDLNRNGVIDRGEDWIFWFVGETHGARVKRYYSVEVIRAATEKKVFGPEGPPSSVASLQECEAYWRDRNSLRAFPLIPRYCPNLKVILVAGQEDHVQACPAFPGIQQAYDGLGLAGVWRRLNPDAEYVRLVLGPRTPRDTPDNDANCVIPLGQMRRFAHPVGRPFLRPAFQTAALLEAADRVYRRCADTNLKKVLWQGPKGR